MNSTTKGILTVLGVGVLVYVAYKKFALPDSKKVIKNYLDATFGFDAKHETFVNSADKGYLKAWSDALMNGKDTFVSNGVTYITYGGKIKK